MQLLQKRIYKIQMLMLWSSAPMWVLDIQVWLKLGFWQFLAISTFFHLPMGILLIFIGIRNILMYMQRVTDAEMRHEEYDMAGNE